MQLNIHHLFTCAFNFVHMCLHMDMCVVLGFHVRCSVAAGFWMQFLWKQIRMHQWIHNTIKLICIVCSNFTFRASRLLDSCLLGSCLSDFCLLDSASWTLASWTLASWPLAICKSLGRDCSGRDCSESWVFGSWLFWVVGVRVVGVRVADRSSGTSPLERPWMTALTV